MHIWTMWLSVWSVCHVMLLSVGLWCMFHIDVVHGVYVDAGCRKVLLSCLCHCLDFAYILLYDGSTAKGKVVPELQRQSWLS